MSDNIIHIQRAMDDNSSEQLPITIEAMEHGDEHMAIGQGQSFSVTSDHDMSDLINDPEFQRAVQEQVASSGGSGEQTIYVQVTTTSSSDQTNAPSIVLNQPRQQQILHKQQQETTQIITTTNANGEEQQVVVLMPAEKKSDDQNDNGSPKQSLGTLRQELTRQIPTTPRTIVVKQNAGPTMVRNPASLTPQARHIRPNVVGDSDAAGNPVPISHRCLLCNSAMRTTLRTIKKNFVIMGLMAELMTPIFPHTDDIFKVCDSCIGVLDKMKDMRDNMMANFKSVEGNFDHLQISPLTKLKPKDQTDFKRKRSEDEEPINEHDYHRSESTFNRSKKAIEISGLLTKQYLNIAPFTDEERLSIAGVINVAAPTELAAKIMKCPALLNALKKLILLDTNHTCEKLCSSTQLPGPSVLRLKGVNTISQDDLISEIIVEMRRCMPFVMDLLFTICRPLHAPRVECREIMAIMYALGMYCRNPSLTAVRRININKVLTNRTQRPRSIHKASGVEESLKI